MHSCLALNPALPMIPSGNCVVTILGVDDHSSNQHRYRRPMRPVLHRWWIVSILQCQIDSSLTLEIDRHPVRSGCLNMPNPPRSILHNPLTDRIASLQLSPQQQ